MENKLVIQLQLLQMYTALFELILDSELMCLLWKKKHVFLNSQAVNMWYWFGILTLTFFFIFCIFPKYPKWKTA